MKYRQPIVYVLQLNDNCWYVGYTRNLSSRMNAHFEGRGSKWTQLHKPVAIAMTIKGTKNIERLVTLEMMKIRGTSKVRGARWCSTVSEPRVNQNMLDFITVRYCTSLQLA